MISKQQRDKSKTCFGKGWDVIPKQNAEFHNNMIDISSPFLNQLFWQYPRFAKHFRSHVILKTFGRQYSQWHPPSRNFLVSWSPTFKPNSCHSYNCSLEMVEDPTMTSHLLSGLYHLENDGYMGFVDVGQKSGICRCWSTNLSGRGMSHLGKDIWAIDDTMRPGYTT